MAGTDRSVAEPMRPDAVGQACTLAGVQHTIDRAIREAAAGTWGTVAGLGVFEPQERVADDLAQVDLGRGLLTLPGTSAHAAC